MGVFLRLFSCWIKQNVRGSKEGRQRERENGFRQSVRRQYSAPTSYVCYVFGEKHSASILQLAIGQNRLVCLVENIIRDNICVQTNSCNSLPAIYTICILKLDCKNKISRNTIQILFFHKKENHLQLQMDTADIPNKLH